MKLSYSREDIQRWRDRMYCRTGHSVVKTERQALAFINSVGFCLAAKADGIELPNLWNAVTGNSSSVISKPKSDRSYYLSYAWEIQNILPNHNSVYYGKVFRRRPSLVSREYFPYFYSLSERTGAGNEYVKEYEQGRLSPMGKHVMDALTKNPALTTRELRNTIAGKGKSATSGMEKALEELQKKMFACRVIGNGNQVGAEWAPVLKCFPAEVRKGKIISLEKARYALLKKYFHNQLITSIDSIHNVFGWSRQTIYRTIGQLMNAGVITTTVLPDGTRGKHYCFIH